MPEVSTTGVSELASARGVGGSRKSNFWWIGKRLIAGVLVVLCVTIIVFIATQVLPGDPAKAIYGKSATPQLVAALNHEFGLDRPLWVQYLSWLGGLFHGDLGTSIALKAPVATVLPARLGATLLLVVLAFVIAVPLSLLLGTVTAMRRDSDFDKVTFGSALVLTAMPDFVIGLLLVIVFGTTVFTILPPVSLFPPGAFPLAYPLELVMPVATLVLVIVPYLYRLVRGSMIDVLESDYVQMARLKGMPRSIVMRRHALPNALVPVIQATGVLLGVVLAGTIVVEFIFRYPGLGSLFWNAVDNRDLQMIQIIVLIYTVGVVLCNLLADIATILVTPRLRAGGR